jgi:mannose-6-phosphate isomerase-like protein (cupin superfamily)
MLDAGKHLTMPDGTSFSVVESGSSSDRAEVIFEITMAPGAMGPPRHWHPAQEESWEVQTGELSVLVNNRWCTLAAGESLTIPPGAVHTLANRSAATVRFHDAHYPALDFQEYIEDLDRLTRFGRLSTRMTARTLIYGAMVLVEHRPMQLSANPAQRAAETLLASVGRLLGYRVRT